MSERQRFSAPIYRVGMNYCVDVPDKVGTAIGGGRYVNVKGEAAGTGFRTRLTPRGGDRYRLFLNSAVRAAAAAGVGDVVRVELWRDELTRETELPADLASALGAVEGAREAFDGMSEAQRTGMVDFLGRARTASTRERYVERVIDNVRGQIGR